MSKEKKRVPRLRFPGFTGDWEQRKLKSIANTIVAGGDIDKTKIKEIGTYPVIANALTKEGIVGYYNDDYRIEAPAVTVTGRGDIGVAKARHQNFTPVVRLLSLTTAHDVDFIEHAINNLKIVSESTGVPQLTVPQLSNYKIHITSIIEEQKIGVFISKLDNLITLHQRKLNHLVLKKKSLLQKLFPKNEDRYPELRFPGFTDAWEQRKLKSIANTIVAGGDIDKTKIKEIGTYPVIANALTKEGIVGYYNDDYRIEAPAVTVTGRGDIGVAKARHQNFTPVVRLLSLTTAHDVDFIEHAINNLKIVSESTGVPQLTVPQLSNYKIHITSIIEEQKIGVFISKLDNLITLHQRKLDHLLLQKKALLQQMFV